MTHRRRSPVPWARVLAAPAFPDTAIGRLPNAVQGQPLSGPSVGSPRPAVPVSDRVAILLDGEFYYTAEPLCRKAVHPLDATVGARRPSVLLRLLR